MSDDEMLAMPVHLSAKLDALDERLAELEADVAHLQVYALRPRPHVRGPDRLCSRRASVAHRSGV